MTETIKEVALINLEGEPLILDIRSHQNYQKLHLKQPHFHIPAANLDIQRFIQKHLLKTGKTLYLISQTGDTSLTIAKRFQALGYPHVVNIQGGILMAQKDKVSMQENDFFNSKRLVLFWAGAFIFIGVLLALFISQAFYLIPLTIGFLLILESIIGTCFIAKLFHHHKD